MSVTSGIFMFEIIVEEVNSLVKSSQSIIKCNFTDVFSLTLRHPKEVPSALPVPPEPTRKNKTIEMSESKIAGKGKNTSDQAIQSDQSVLFSSSAELLLQKIKQCSLALFLWGQQEKLVYIGSATLPWHSTTFLQKVYDCEQPHQVSFKEDFYILQESTGKMIATIKLQVKLTYVTDRVMSALMTPSEYPNVRESMTCINSKTTSYKCTINTTDKDFIENYSNCVANGDYKNTLGPKIKIILFNGTNYYMDHTNKPPETLDKLQETCPNIDYVIDYVREIMTPHDNNIRLKATDINRKTYCSQTGWPMEEVAKRLRKEALSGPCSLCNGCGKKSEGSRDDALDIPDLRRPYSGTACKIPRAMRTYIGNLFDDDNIEFYINDLIWPYGNKDYALATNAQDFLLHTGAFTQAVTIEGVSTQNTCLQKNQQQIIKRKSCASSCSKRCDETKSDAGRCGAQACLYDIPIETVYIVYYFTVEYNFDMKPESKEPSTNDPTSKESSTKGTSSGGPSSKNPSSGAPSSKNPSPGAPSSKNPSPGEPSSKNPSPAAPSSKNPSSGAPSSKNHSSGAPSSDDSSDSSESDRFAKFGHCPPTCPILKMAESVTCSKAICRIQTAPKEDSSDSKCTSPVCTSKLQFPPSPADSNIVIKFKEIYNPCCVKSCDISERVKEFIADSAVRDKSRRKCREMEDAQDPCYCDCVCTFKFSSKTTYCCICGGYECLGDDTRDLPDYAKPHPCPVYHKLYDKKTLKVKSPWPEETVEKKDSNVKVPTTKSAEKTASAIKAAKTGAPEKEVNAKEAVTQETKKKKKEGTKKAGKTTASVVAQPSQTPIEKTKVEKNKPDVNKYAYPPVPKHMGWNWLAKDIPGMEPRLKWRPGAANKILVRRYRALMGSDTLAKKKRALLQRKKKLEMKPTLVITKQGGEFTVQMEVFKKYSKERLLHQYPYDEKPPLIYTIGKTAAEQNKLQRQRDRRARRDSRRKSRLLQSTFRDKCQEICLKAYNQALGLLPLPNPNNPECPCATHDEPSVSPAIDSCSCSDEVTISSSDTDHDEWIIEFTPPVANWDGKAKHPPLKEHSDTQYNYLDFKVKLFDRSGNPVPRFFKSHEGKQECSDLGGFWGPGHVWLEINKDGYIGPDERWVPMNFFGPDGISYSAEDGSFTDNTGQLLKLGIDGYIDKDLKWVWYMKKKINRNSGTSTECPTKTAKSPTEANANVKTQGKSKGTAQTSSSQPTAGDKGTGSKATEKGTKEKKTEKNKKDKKVVVVAAPKQGTSAKKNSAEKQHNNVVMHLSVTRDRHKVPHVQKDGKPYVDPDKMSRYREIMAGFQAYDDFCVAQPQATTNRASNTSRKKSIRLAPHGILKNIESVTNVTASYGQTVNNTSSLNTSKATTWYASK